MNSKKCLILLSIAIFFMASSSISNNSRVSVQTYQGVTEGETPVLPEQDRLLANTAQQGNGTWVQILNSVGEVHIGGQRIIVTDYATGNVFEYTGTPFYWNQIGTPARMLAYDTTWGRLYALSPDGGSVWQYTWEPFQWEQIGTAASAIYAGELGLFAVNPTSGNLWHYNDEPFNWTEITDSPMKFVIPSKTSEILWIISPDGTQIWRWLNSTLEWVLNMYAPAQCSITYASEIYFDDAQFAIICNQTDIYKTVCLDCTGAEWVPMDPEMEIKSVTRGNTGTIALDIWGNVLQWQNYGFQSNDGVWNYISDNCFDAIFGGDERYPVCARECNNHNLWCYYKN